MRRPDMRTAWEVVVVGSAGSGFLARGVTIEEARRNARGERVYEEVGGKGATQALAAARLGARVALVACIGEDRRGQDLLARLEGENVSTMYVVRDAHEPTGMDFIFSSEQEGARFVSVPGASDNLAVEHIHYAAEPLQAAKILLAPLDAPIAPIREAARLAKQAGLKVILDAAPEAHAPNELIHLADLVTTDAHGALALTGIEPRTADDARKVATGLLERGAAAVTVDTGREGLLLSWPGGERWLPNLSMRDVDASVAQDAFAAGMAVALLDGRAIADAGPFAQMVSALARSEVGAHASLPVRQIVMEALARI